MPIENPPLALITPALEIMDFQESIVPVSVVENSHCQNTLASNVFSAAQGGDPLHGREENQENQSKGVSQQPFREHGLFEIESTPQSQNNELHELALIASQIIDEESIKAILHANPNVMLEINEEGYNPLTLALLKRKYGLVHCYMELGVFVDDQAWGMALESLQDPLLIDILLGKSVSCEKDSLFKGNFLHQLVTLPCVNSTLLEEVILQNADKVNQYNSSSHTPFTLAIAKGRQDLVELYIKLKVVDIFANSSMYSGNALDIILENKDSEMLDCVLKATSAYGYQASDFRAQSKQSTAGYFERMLASQDMLSSFLKYYPNVDVNYCNAEGLSPLMYAIQQGSMEMIGNNMYLQNAQRLLNLPNIDVNLTGKFSYTALEHAIKYRNYSMVELLIHRGSEVNRLIKGNTDMTRTPLYFAVATGELNMVKLLVSYGASIHEGGENLTPLMLASRSGYVDIVNFLIERNADMYIENTEGESALSLALDRQQRDVEFLLRKAMSQ